MDDGPGCDHLHKSLYTSHKRRMLHLFLLKCEKSLESIPLTMFSMSLQSFYRFWGSSIAASSPPKNLDRAITIWQGRHAVPAFRDLISGVSFLIWSTLICRFSSHLDINHRSSSCKAFSTYICTASFVHLPSSTFLRFTQPPDTMSP